MKRLCYEKGYEAFKNVQHPHAAHVDNNGHYYNYGNKMKRKRTYVLPLVRFIYLNIAFGVLRIPKLD